MKLIKWAAVMLTAICLAGCATTATNEFCLVSSSIRPSVDDVLTDGTARQILAHDQYGERVCNWRP